MHPLFKKMLKESFRFFSRFTVGLVYDKSYLRGRWFEDSIEGWKWAWKGLITQKILRINGRIPWPASPFVFVGKPENILFDPNDMNNFQSYGIYFYSSLAKIIIGRGTYIAPNVGLITANHDPYNLDKHLPGKDIVIGKHCWIGMNSVILPGVVLGDHTIVGAGSVVTKSFPEGYCVIAGVPAKKIKDLDKSKFFSNDET